MSAGEKGVKRKGNIPELKTQKSEEGREGFDHGF